MWRLEYGVCALLAVAVAVAVAAGCRPAGGTCLSGESMTAEQCAAVEQLVLPAELPPARGNAHGDDPAAAGLGFQLFYDARLSKSQELRCASCHLPERAFQDGLAVPKSPGALQRNTPTTLNSARLTTLFWDGRADSLWSQALLPLESPAELDFTRLELAHRIARSFQALYERAYGPLPDLSDAARFPPRGKPGDPAWEAMSQADRDTVDTIAANIGKSFEAYLRKQAAGPSRVDRFLAGDKTALAPDEAHGVAVLAREGCLGCHAGPMTTDERFHNLGVPAWPGVELDQGRAAAAPALALSDFTARSKYWDGPVPPARAGDDDPAAGAFRTPPLRNLTRSAPYGHNGRFATLEEAVDFHLAGGGRGAAGFVGEVDAAIRPRALAAGDRAALLAALRALDGEYPKPPWNSWPQN